MVLLAVLSVLLGACAPAAGTAQHSDHYLIYLHGRIIEDQGVNAVSPDYGPYEFRAIKARFETAGFIFLAERREANADVDIHADRTATEVNRLLADGVPPGNITILGASKGAHIAALASQRLQNPDLNIILLAGCSPGGVKEMLERGVTLSGRVLTIRDSGDALSGSCGKLVDVSPNISAYEAITTETGLGHGLLYRPLDDWVDPSLGWMKENASH